MLVKVDYAIGKKISDRIKKMGGGMMKRPMMKKGGAAKGAKLNNKRSKSFRSNKINKTTKRKMQWKKTFR